MKLAGTLTFALLLAAAAGAQTRATSSSMDTPASRPAPDVVHEGEIETYIARNGESTGWRLRTRNAQGRRHYVEVLLTAEVAQGVRSNTRVQVRGTMQTRRYDTRGEVPVLVAKEVIEVARR